VQETSKAKGWGRVELLIDRAQLPRRKKWEIKTGRPTNKGPG
jgi:hypothetical protein